MDAATLFAQMPTTPELIIAQVRRQLDDEAWSGLADRAIVLDRLADQAVRDLWGSRVKTFVPVLALREARQILREQEVLLTTEHPERQITDEPAATRPVEERRRRDVLPIGGDSVSVDDRDVLHL